MYKPSQENRGRKQISRAAAAALANSRLLTRAQRLFAENEADWNRPLGKFDKILVGLYLLLHDYGAGKFPALSLDRNTVYQGEREYVNSIPGVSATQFLEAQLRKPFWDGESFGRYAADFSRIVTTMKSLGAGPPGTVLELGCGSGWMTEWLSMIGFEAWGLTISENEAVLGRRRAAGLAAKGLQAKLEFVTGPMEEADKLGLPANFDSVLIYEALHHAFDWKETMRAASGCLRKGGWFFICREPNLIHTFVSYRVGRLSKTHEIGMSRRQLCRELRAAGFAHPTLLSGRLHCYMFPHWLAAQKLG